MGSNGRIKEVEGFNTTIVNLRKENQSLEVQKEAW